MADRFRLPPMLPSGLRLVFAVALTLPARLPAQEPVPPYDPSGSYTSSLVNVQLTAPTDGGRDLLFAWGRLAAGGSRGRWMRRAEVTAGVRAGQRLVDRVMAGPEVTLAVAFPGQYTTAGPGTRAEPYLLAGGGGLAVLDLSDGERAGLAPTVFAGIGLRLFDDEWDISLDHLEVVVEKRFGLLDELPQLYVRFGRATPRGPARDGTPDPPPALPHRQPPR